MPRAASFISGRGAFIWRQHAPTCRWIKNILPTLTSTYKQNKLLHTRICFHGSVLNGFRTIFVSYLIPLTKLFDELVVESEKNIYNMFSTATRLRYFIIL